MVGAARGSAKCDVTRRVLQRAAGVGGVAAALVLAAAAAAQTAVFSAVIGDLERDGLEIQIVCDGSERKVFLTSREDMENAYSRMLGQPGRVPRKRFVADGEQSFFALDRFSLGEQAQPEEFVYVLTPAGDGEGGPAEAAAGFSTLIDNAETVGMVRPRVMFDLEEQRAGFSILDENCPVE